MGKSTLLKMMAGLEQPSNGEVLFMPGYTRGILPQEPVLDEGKTVLGNVEDGVGETKALIERYNKVAAKLAAEYSDELLEEMGRLQEQLDHRDAWDLDARLEQAMDALRCPPDAEVATLSGGERRRAGQCTPRHTRLVPPAAAARAGAARAGAPRARTQQPAVPPGKPTRWSSLDEPSGRERAEYLTAAIL